MLMYHYTFCKDVMFLYEIVVETTGQTFISNNHLFQKYHGQAKQWLKGLQHKIVVKVYQTTTSSYTLVNNDK